MQIYVKKMSRQQFSILLVYLKNCHFHKNVYLLYAKCHKKGSYGWFWIIKYLVLLPKLHCETANFLK